MSDTNKAQEEFKSFAENKLNIHLEELSVRYENEKINEDTLKDAYETHRQIFDKELDEKLSSLTKDDNDHNNIFEDIKKSFIEKLRSPNTFKNKIEK